MGDAERIGKGCRHRRTGRGLPKKLGRGTLGDRLEAAAFALFIGYVLSECSGVTVKKLTDRGQSTSSSWRPSSWSPSWPSWPSSSQPCSTPLSFVRVRATHVAPQNIINMNYLHFEMQLRRGFCKSADFREMQKTPILQGLNSIIPYTDQKLRKIAGAGPRFAHFVRITPRRAD